MDKLTEAMEEVRSAMIQDQKDLTEAYAFITQQRTHITVGRNTKCLGCGGNIVNGHKTYHSPECVVGKAERRVKR